MIVKKHVQQGTFLLAVCDTELKGKTFSEGKLQLDLTSGFYDGKEMKREELVPLLKHASALNIIGKESIALGISQKLFTDKDVKKIASIPYVHVYIV